MSQKKSRQQQKPKSEIKLAEEKSGDHGSLKPVEFEILLEEIVEGNVTTDNIKSEYIRNTGMLRLELSGVVAKSKWR